MRHRHLFENKYCTGCHCTTRHEVKDLTFACQRCGVVKYPVRSRVTIRIAELGAHKTNCA